MLCWFILSWVVECAVCDRLDFGHLAYFFHGLILAFIMRCLDFGHLAYFFHGFISIRDFMDAVPNVLEEPLLSSLLEMVLLNLMSLLQLCEGSLQLFWSVCATQQVVWNVSIITSKDFCRPIEAAMR